MKKLKNALLLSTVALASSAAQAQWEGNWLLGISGGYVWNNDQDIDVTIFHPATTLFPAGTVTSFSVGNGDDGNHGVWGILGGYQARCNHWLLGLEVNVDWRGHHHDDDNGFVVTDALGQNWVGSFNWDKETAVGLTARLGYEMAPYFMPYIRLGAEWSEDQLDFSTATFNPVILVNGVPLVVSANGGDRTSTRFVGGLGFEVPITALNCLSLRVEWNYISKGKDVEASGLASDNGTLWVADSSAHTNLLKAALVWNFM